MANRLFWDQCVTWEVAGTHVYADVADDPSVKERHERAGTHLCTFTHEVLYSVVENAHTCCVRHISKKLRWCILHSVQEPRWQYRPTIAGQPSEGWCPRRRCHFPFCLRFFDSGSTTDLDLNLWQPPILEVELSKLIFENATIRQFYKKTFLWTSTVA